MSGAMLKPPFADLMQFDIVSAEPGRMVLPRSAGRVDV
jgi:hypothetical protein